jgi:hypothetical protein
MRVWTDWAPRTQPVHTMPVSSQIIESDAGTRCHGSGGNVLLQTEEKRTFEA